MRGVKNVELRSTCVELREKERLSLREIHIRTGAPKGSLSAWLKNHPLTEGERETRIQAGVQKSRDITKKDRGSESWLYRMASKDLTQSDKGHVAETAVLLRMILNRFKVFGAKNDGEKADWIVEVPDTGRIWKIQVKSTCASVAGLPFVLLTCSDGHNKRRRYIKGEFDFIVGHNLFTDTAYVWSWAELENQKTSVTITHEAEERWDKLRA